MDIQIRMIEDEIRDLERIVKADIALFELQKLPERRTALYKEIGELEYKIDRLRERIDSILASLD